VALGRISGEMLEQNLNLTRNLTFNDDALTITTDGKIGIKNNNPGVELDVTGTARANTLTVLGDLSMEWTISMDAQDTLNFAYNNNLTMSLATNGALLLNGIGLDTIGSGQKVFTASGSISAGDVVRLNANGTVSAGISIIDNPNAYNTSAGDYFGYNVAISESYAIVGAYNEDDAGGTSSGKAYIFDTITGNLLYTLDNPNAYDTSADDRFGDNVAISESYAIVGAYPEDDAGGTHSGKAYIYSTSTGNLLYTLDNPNDFDTSQNDQFGFSVAISESYAIVGARFEDDAGGTDSGKAYIFDTSTGNLLYTLDNPNAYNTTSGDRFGDSVSISESYAIVGAYGEDDLGGSTSGKAYIFDTSTGNLLHTLDNPNAYNTSVSDFFGSSVAISESYAIVGAQFEDDAGGTSSGKAYIFDTITGNLLYTLDNPNAYNTSVSDRFGFSVAISESYAIVGALAEDDPGGTDSGKAYIFDTSTGNLLYTLDNPNAYNTSASDLFSRSVAISESYAIVGTWSEDDAGGLGSGKAYIYNLVILSNWIGIAAEDIADTATGIIDLPGAINRSQTGLTTNSIYYVDVNGSLTTTPTTFGMIGKAISTTDLQIFGNAVIEFSKAIDVDFTTNTPTTTSGLVLTSDGDSSYSFQNSIDISGAIAANSLQSYFVKEYANIVATSSTIVVADITTTGTVVYMTADMTGDTTVNVRGDASTTLDDLLAVNESVTVVFLFTTGATAYINNILEIDNQSRTVKWNGGSAPTAGTANAIDVYSYTIIKTAANTYTVLGSFSSFA